MLDVPQSLMENKEETLEYFKQMTDEMCWRAALKYQKDEGLKEGRQEGLQDGRQEERIKMAKSLMEQGVSAEVIAKASGLSIEEIEKL